MNLKPRGSTCGTWLFQTSFQTQCSSQHSNSPEAHSAADAGTSYNIYPSLKKSITFETQRYSWSWWNTHIYIHFWENNDDSIEKKKWKDPRNIYGGKKLERMRCSGYFWMYRPRRAPISPPVIKWSVRSPFVPRSSESTPTPTMCPVPILLNQSFHQYKENLFISGYSTSCTHDKKSQNKVLGEKSWPTNFCLHIKSKISHYSICTNM